MGWEERWAFRKQNWNISPPMVIKMWNVQSKPPKQLQQKNHTPIKVRCSQMVPVWNHIFIQNQQMGVSPVYSYVIRVPQQCFCRLSLIVRITVMMFHTKVWWLQKSCMWSFRNSNLLWSSCCDNLATIKSLVIVECKIFKSSLCRRHTA